MDMLHDDAWLAAARRGETWALEHLYRVHKASVYALCRRMLDRQEDAEDAMQATFVKAFRALPSFRGDSAVATWLYRVAANEAISVMRVRRRAAANTVGNAANPAPDQALRQEEHLAVHEALDRVKPENRAVLVLRFWEDLSYREIAEVLQVPLPFVKLRLAQARAEFRRCYDDRQC